MTQKFSISSQQDIVFMLLKTWWAIGTNFAKGTKVPTYQYLHVHSKHGHVINTSACNARKRIPLKPKGKIQQSETIRFAS